MTASDVLIFVEDPGAVNAVVDLPAVLAERGVTSTVLAAGHAVDYLGAFPIEFTDVGDADDAAAVLDARGPRAVVAGTSENRATLGLGLIEAARARGLPSVGFVDGPTAAEYRFRGPGEDAMGFAPAWLVVPDAVTAARYRDLGFAADRVVECGHPYLDRVRKMGEALASEGRAQVRARALPAAPADRPVLVFLAEISDGLEPGQHERGPDYTLSGRGGSARRVDIVLEEVLDAIAGVTPRPYVVLRLHPKNTADEFAAYAGEIDFVSAGGAAAETVFAADLCVGLTTFLLFEAAVMGTATLSVIPRPAEAGWLTAIGLGITPEAHERRVLREVLSAQLADPKRPLGKPAAEVLHFGGPERMADLVCRLLSGEGGN